MTPETLIIDRRFKGIGRIKKASGTTNPTVRRKIERMLTALYDAGRVDILKAIQDGSLTLLIVHHAYQRHSLDNLPLGETLQPLVDVMRDWIQGLRSPEDYSEKHIISFGTTLKYIQRAAPTAPLAELPTVLEQLRESLGREHPRSFNLARAAALAFVRSTLKRNHPLWARIAAVEPRKVIAKRTGNPLSVRQMRGFFPSPEHNHVDAIAWGMAMTGMGPGEYWGRWHIGEGRIQIRGTKRAGRVRAVPLVRPPTVPKIHHRTFEDAVRERTQRSITAYDLRRTYAHWLEMASVPRTRRRIYMGHGAGDITGLYERHEVDEYLSADAERLRLVIDGASVESEGSVASPATRKSLVYFIQHAVTRHIKIGVARNPLRRLINLQIGSSAQLSLLGVLPGGVEREREIHERFASLRVRGEWFRETPEFRSWLRAALSARRSTKTPTIELHTDELAAGDK